MAGTATLALLLDTAMPAPPDGAGADKVIMQIADPGGVTVPGEQVTDEGKTGTVKLTEPDAPLAGIEEPPAVEATTPVS